MYNCVNECVYVLEYINMNEKHVHEECEKKMEWNKLHAYLNIKTKFKKKSFSKIDEI